MTSSDSIKMGGPALEGFHAENPGFDVRDFDFHDPAAARTLLQRLAAAGVPENDVQARIEHLKAGQRLLRLDVNADLGSALLARGIGSANQLARMAPAAFAAEVGEPLGLTRAAALDLHQRANAVRNKSMHLWASLSGTAGSAYFRGSPMDTVGEDIKEVFQGLPSYQELFGTLDYCACPECRSILGPAAYLVDLLRIIDECITVPNAASIDPDLLFTARRPDISLIPLNCDNTNTLLPYLQIVNERLLAQAGKALGGIDADTVIARMAGELVYPLALPFNAALDRIRIVLDKMGAPYPAILAAWQVAAPTVAARRLGLSPDQQSIVTTAQCSAAALAPFYAVSDPATLLATLKDAAVFMDKAWLDYSQLDALLNQDLSQAEQKAGLQVNFFINAGLANTWVQLVEPAGKAPVLDNLGLAQLDQINRLRRLAAATGQPPAVVDWALRCSARGAAPVLAQDSLLPLQQLFDVAAALGLDPVDAGVLLGPVKTYGAGQDGAGSAFDRRFNALGVLASQAPYRPAGNPLNPAYKDAPLAWTPGSGSAADTSAISRILPGLHVGLADANLLGLWLYGSQQQALTVATISELLRHALLMRALQLPAQRYLLLMRMLAPADPRAPTLAEIRTAIDANAWLAQTGLTLYQLDYIVNGVASVYVNPLYLPSKVPLWLAGLRATIQAGTPGAAPGIEAQVAVLFGLGLPVSNPLLCMALAAVPLPVGAADWPGAFLAATPDGQAPLYEPYVQAVLQWVSRWALLAQALRLDAAQLQNAAAFPAAYALPASFDALPWTALRHLFQVARMMQQHGDLQHNLLGYIALASAGAPASDEALALLDKAFSWPPDAVRALLAGPVPADAVVAARLACLQDCFALMTALGADPSFMAAIAALADLPASANWPVYLQSVANVDTRAASLYGAQWDNVSALLEGAIAARLRDAVLALVLAQLHDADASIGTASNVYEFLLTDVEMGPVTTISRIKEALNAAQLYLQRCRLRLEPGVQDMSRIQAPWWEWMMNYRIWEANREIFLYPENYLVPTLRKSATPQFDDLAQALQQSQITPAYVADAFANYINGFAAVAQLQPVDAYRTHIDDHATLYLLARSKTAPYTFYYCLQPENMPWTPWQKIDLSINSAHCTLVYAFNRPFLFWNEIKKSNSSEVSGSSGDVSTSNSVTYIASVMYSFLNQQGEWVQPQTLADQEVELFESDDGRDIDLRQLPIFNGLFDMDALAWNKVFALNATAANYAVPPPYPAEAQRLVVMLGPDLVATGATVDAQTTSPTSDPNARSFWINLHLRAEDHNRMVIAQLSGNTSVRHAWVLDFSLDRNVLVQRNELLLTDPCVPGMPLSTVRAEILSSGEALQIAHSALPIAENRNAAMAGMSASGPGSAITGPSFINVGVNAAQSLAIYQALKAGGVIDDSGKVVAAAMPTLDLYALLADMTVYDPYQPFGPLQFTSVLQVLFNHMDVTLLFGAIGAGNATVIPVGSQPGWFMLSVANEVFLLSPEAAPGKPAFTTFAEGIGIGAPLVTSLFAVMQYQVTTPSGETVTGRIDAAASKQVYDALVFFGLVTNGVAASRFTVADVGMALQSLLPPLSTVLSKDQLPYIYRALKNFPILFSADFIGPTINAPTAQAIYTALQFFALVDPNGRVDEDNLSSANVQLALADLLYAQTITKAQLAGFYRAIAQAFKAVVLTYHNEGSAAGFSKTSDLVFRLTRLSTGAINKVSRALLVNGVDGLLALSTQSIPVDPVLPIDRFAPSATNIVLPDALDATQVDFDGLYGQYYWEIFYFTPMLVASSLGANQQFQQAQTWLQYIFNPTLPERFVDAPLLVEQSGQDISLSLAQDVIGALMAHDIGTPPKPILDAQHRVNPAFAANTDLAFLKTAGLPLDDRQLLMVRNILLNFQLNAPSSHFWNFRPFRNHTLQSLRDMLSDDNPAIRVYNDDPFDPFAIARLRIGAFEKSTLMAYVDNLVAWGDRLFTEDTWESITAAYMLYVYADNLLGPRPQQVGACPGAELTLTFADIKAKYPSGIPQFLIDLEHFIPDASAGQPMMGHAFNDLFVYFGVPENSSLAARWDTVADRMYKINQSMNIQGVVRTLALFEPPLDPLDLVKAAAAGDNVQATASAGHDLAPYRFGPTLASAQSLCAILIELGNALLAALEKQDAEHMAALRTSQESQLLGMATQVKQDRIDELTASIGALTSASAGAAYRQQFYSDLISTDLIDYEQTSLEASAAALAFTILGSVSKSAAAIGYAVPQAGSPFAMTYGGAQIGNAINAVSGAFEIGGSISSYIAQRAATMGGYARRRQDWALQQHQAQTDLQSIGQQLAGANSQLAGARQDLATHKTSIAQNQALATYLAGKFNNQALYQWISSRMSAIYFQTYNLALQLARQAQTAYQFETGRSQTFLDFDYWDSLHKGLCAGEGLRLALARMNNSYLTGDTRSLEIEKTISLAMLAPDQLLALKTGGQCDFSLGEALFDYDYPGHYARMIKTVSVSIPAIVGPYQNIKAILTQTANSVATAPDIGVVRYLLGLGGDAPASGLRQNWASRQQIAISRGIDSSGLFQLDFSDPRYLPFEHTGAVSSWHLSMPLDTNRFDFAQLSDVLITVRYTAQHDGQLESDVRQALAQVPLGGGVYASGSMQSAAWQTFLLDHGDPAGQTLTLQVALNQLGYFRSLSYTNIWLRLTLADGVVLAPAASFLTLTAGNEPAQAPLFTQDQAQIADPDWNGKTLPPGWNLRFDLANPQLAPLLANGFIDGSKLLDLQLIALYDAKVF